MKPLITNQRDLRRHFWWLYPGLDKRKAGGGYKTETRVAFVEFLDAMQRNGVISEKLAQRATL